MLELNAMDIGTVLGILILNLVVGLAFAKRAGRNTEDFYLAGRSLPWWLLGTSMVATTFALDTPLVITEYIIDHGLFENWLWISLAVSHLFVALLLSALWRRSGATTDIELCTLRYHGRAANMLRGFKGVFFAIGLNCISLGTVFFAVDRVCRGFGLADVTLGGVELPVVVLVGGLLLTMIYSASAGLWGVVTTDMFQFVLALGGAVLVAWCALGDARIGGIEGLRAGLDQIRIDRAIDREALDITAGPDALLGLAPPEVRPDPVSLVPAGVGDAAAGKARISLLGLDFDDRGMTLLVFLGVMWWAWKFSDGGGILIQRMLAARDERHATLGALWFCLGHYVLRWWPWALAAFAALLLFRDAGPDLVAGEAYARLVVEVVPPGLRGFILAFFLAAFMSTVDTHIQLGSSYIVNDVYRPFVHSDASERHYVWVGRAATVVLIAGAFIVSRVSGSFRQIYLFILNLVAGAGVVFLLRWFWWRVNAWSEITALASSLLIAGGLSLWNSVAPPGERVPGWEITLLNVFGSLLLWVPVTFLTRPTDRDHLRSFYARTRPWGFWGAVRNPGESGPGLPKRELAAWLGSVAAIFTSLFAIRALVLGDTAYGLSLLVPAMAVGAAVVATVPAGAPSPDEPAVLDQAGDGASVEA